MSYQIDFTRRGNSRTALAHRAGKVVRKANQWKVASGQLTRKALRRWVREVEAACLENPGEFAHWGIAR